MSKKRNRKPATQRVEDLADEALDGPADDQVETLEAQGLVAASDDARPKRREGHIRPSQVREMIAAHAATAGTNPASIDPFKFILENGLPNPTRHYRVTARKGGRMTKPLDIEHASDETDAINQTIKRLGISQSHQWVFRCLCVEE